ncbi:thioredoxin family protein [Candidatus Bathyarchaeota archaeon]|nr:thioredoxin family protein [Candidatus Bathyarchaeota archaeon]
MPRPAVSNPESPAKSDAHHPASITPTLFAIPHPKFQQNENETMAGPQNITSAAELQTLLSSTTYVVVDFFADWCPPCKTIAPIFESLATKHAVPGTLAFAKVNVDHNQEAARTFSVTSMPTFLFFKEGKQVAVNGQVTIQGADPRSLMAAVEKLKGLAAKRAEA